MDFKIENNVLEKYTGKNRDVVIPEGVTRIGDRAFWWCESLKSVTFPDSVASIGNSAFSDCESLTSITIPDSVTSIGDWAFSYCKSLTSITIPDSVTSIGETAFEYCTSLTEINVSKFNNKYTSCDGVLFNKDKTTLIKYPAGKAGKEYEIPDGVTSIGGHAFSYCKSLTSIIIPNSVTSIGNSAFKNCESLTSITIPNSVTSIDYYAFSGCESLTDITIPDSVTSIGGYAFSFCTSLTSITIPDSVKSIGGYAFERCTGLKEFINLSRVPIKKILRWDALELENWWSPNELLSEMYVEYKPIAAEMYLKHQAKYSEEQQSKYNKYIKSQGGKLLQRFINEGKTESLVALLNTGLVTASALNKGFEAASGKAEITAMLLDYQDKHIDVEKEREKEEKKLYASLMHIETETEKIKKLFSYKKQEDGTLIITSYKGDETKVTVPEKIGKSTVTAIGKWAFSPCNPYSYYKNGRITEVVLPDTITSIGKCAFKGCTWLTEINVSKFNNKYTSCDGVLFNKDKTTLIKYPEGKAGKGYVIPDSVKSIEFSAFENCSSLTSITVPDSVTRIGDNAFSGCWYLTSITIPDSVTSIGNNAFENCKSLTSVTIPESVTSIGERAFRNCTSLKNVILPKNVKLGYGAFSVCTKVKRKRN